MELVKDFTRQYKIVSREDIADWMSNEVRYTNYQMKTIQDYLESPTHQISILLEQLKLISDWTKRKAAEFDWSKMVVVSDTDREAFTVNRTAERMWFFIKTFNISLPEEQLLAFTAFHDFRRRNNEADDIIGYVASVVGKEAVRKKVVENLQAGLLVSLIWKSNAVYAIEHSIKEAYPAIIKDLKTGPQSQYTRAEVLAEYFKKTRDIQTVKEIVTDNSTDEVAWKGVSILQDISTEYPFLIDHLTGVLSTERLEEHIRFRAAKILIPLGDIAGLNYFVEYVRTKENMDFHQLHPLAGFSNIEGLQQLMTLLYYAKTTKNELDHFKELDSFTLSALQNIAVKSEENLGQVRNAILSFMHENETKIPNLNFLHHTISRMEEQFYANQSTVYSLDGALEELRRIDVN
jgi:hypothetical protein